MARRPTIIKSFQGRIPLPLTRGQSLVEKKNINLRLSAVCGARKRTKLTIRYKRRSAVKLTCIRDDGEGGGGVWTPKTPPLYIYVVASFCLQSNLGS